jgi:hypothetical protein
MSTMSARSEVTPLGRQLRRIWSRAGIACACFLAAALVLPLIQRALGPDRERRASAVSSRRAAREEAPVYVMPNGERRRVVAVVPAEPDAVGGSRGNRALYWWCGLLAAVTIAGAAMQTMRAYATHDEDDQS